VQGTTGKSRLKNEREMRIGKNHTAGRNPAKLQESKADPFIEQHKVLKRRKRRGNAREKRRESNSYRTG
jgi:hypothetical protein